MGNKTRYSQKTLQDIWLCYAEEQAAFRFFQGWLAYGPMDGYQMEQTETTTHSFIIRIWLEETALEAGKARWRGHITHIPSNERSYLNNHLEGIATFIVPYLEAMGVRFNHVREE